MAWEIKVLDLGSLEIDGSRTVATRAPGIRVRLPVQGFLLVGPEHVVVVDTGFRHPEILQRIGLRGFEEPGQALDAQLRAHGVRFGDVRYVLHTHLHLDHAGQTDKFPLTTTAVVNRRELEYSVSGLSGGSYPPDDVKHLVDRLHTRGSLRLLDLEATDEHILGGIRCSAAGGHTEGSMVVYVETAMGVPVRRHRLQCRRAALGNRRPGGRSGLERKHRDDAPIGEGGDQARPRSAFGRPGRRVREPNGFVIVGLRHRHPHHRRHLAHHRPVLIRVCPGRAPVWRRGGAVWPRFPRISHARARARG